MTVVDVNTFIGTHPHRHVPHPDAPILAGVLAREGVTAAWVGHLPSVFDDRVAPGNEALFEEIALHRQMLHPAPTVRPDRADWESELVRCLDAGAVAVRAYPEHWGMAAGDRDLAALAGACAEARRPLVLTVRLEDPARRDWPGAPADLGAATIAQLVRAAPRSRIVVTAAGAALVAEVLALVSARERARLWWDISWIAGPPADSLARLFVKPGARRFLYGSQWPLRLTQTPRANLDLLPASLSGATLATAADVLAW